MPLSDPLVSMGGGAGAEDAEGGTGAPDAVTVKATSVEIVLANGRRLCVPAEIEAAALARLIRLVEGA